MIASASTASSVLVQYELEGKVFIDNGAGGGTANDGVFNGGETGGAGAIVRLLSSNGATTYASANVGGDGRYRVSIPASVPSRTCSWYVKPMRQGTLPLADPWGAPAGCMRGRKTR